MDYHESPQYALSPASSMHAPSSDPSNQQYPADYHVVPSQSVQYGRNSLHAPIQQYPAQYHGAPPSQPVQYALSHLTSLRASPFRPQSRPPPVAGNATSTPQHFGNFTPPVVPQPLLPMGAYTPRLSPSPFVQPIAWSGSSRSSESVYRTPQASFSPGPGTPQLTSTQWLQQRSELEMSVDNTPTQMTDEEQSWSGESLYNTQPSRRVSRTPTQHDHNQMSHSMEDGKGYRRKVPSRTSARNGDDQTGGVSYVTQPTPGSSTTESHPRVDFQHKIRIVGTQGTEAY
ncbi:hypothetical protein B0H13DRAFT_2314611 [Mycena leptocephala]|nr:hypothetical protein B0H13DRAFT_2314611 [Mycena leptocephala]